MKKIKFFCLLFFVSSFAFAHPGIGIVCDSKGNIYYTDLKQIWKISTDGKKTVVVPGVHSHELYMDANDNLYGEHLWYNGEKMNTWGHYVWCLKNDGSLVKVKEPTEGFPDDYGFARDAAGNMYWVERFTVSRFMKKTVDGKITKLAEGKFGFIGWIHSTDDGTIYFTESDKLQKLTPDGKFTVVAENLGSRVTDFSMMGHNYDGYGIWTDKANNIYMAMIGGKKVNRISPDGKVQAIVFSNSLWTVCSGLFDKNGNLWVLENFVTNEMRVRKVSEEELNNSRAQSGPFSLRAHGVATVIIAAAIIINWVLLKLAIKKRRTKLKNQLV